MIDRWKDRVRRWGAVCALCFAGFAASAVAHAEPILFSGGEVRSGEGSWTSQMQITGPGTLSVSAWDLGTPGTFFEPLESLSFSVTQAGGQNVLGSRLGEGELQIGISTAGLYFLNVFMKPSPTSPSHLGVVSWEATFTPVPLPPAVWLLLGGLAWATGLQRKRAKLDSHERGSHAERLALAQ